MKTIRSQFDSDAEDYEEVLPENEDEAMAYVMNKIGAAKQEKAGMKHIEQAATKRLALAAPKVSMDTLKKNWLDYVKKQIEHNYQDIDDMLDVLGKEELEDQIEYHVLRPAGYDVASHIPKDLVPLLKRKTLKDAFKVAFKVSDEDYAAKARAKLLPKASSVDGKVMRFLGDRLDSTINTRNVGQLTYVKWRTSIEINGPRDIVNMYTQFREGSGHKDDSSYLSEVGMTLDQFEKWLISKGAKKVSKPKRKPNYTMYD